MRERARVYVKKGTEAPNPVVERESGKREREAEGETTNGLAVNGSQQREYIRF